MRFFVDYNLQPSHNKDSGGWMDGRAGGISFAVMLH